MLRRAAILGHRFNDLGQKCGLEICAVILVFKKRSIAQQYCVIIRRLLQSFAGLFDTSYRKRRLAEGNGIMG